MAQQRVRIQPHRVGPGPEGNPSPFGPTVQGFPVQLIVYDNPAGPTGYEGHAVIEDDGSLTLLLPIDGPPRPGTTVQIILYPPDTEPVGIEGTTGKLLPDGSFPIIPA